MKQTTTTTRTETDDSPMFDKMNAIAESLDFTRASSEEKLLENLRAIPMPIKIVSIYSMANMHVAWFLTTAKVRKVKAKKEGVSE